VSQEWAWLGLPVGQWIVTLGAAALAAVIVAIGWFVTNWQTSNRENRNREQSMMSGYLAEAFEALANAANRPELTVEYARLIETAVAKIQLFGNTIEVNAVHLFLDEWEKPQPDGRPRGNLYPLLFALRNSLRQRLSLPPLKTPVRWIRPLGGAQ
jgi:hypothetical protein